MKIIFSAFSLEDIKDALREAIRVELPRLSVQPKQEVTNEWLTIKETAILLNVGKTTLFKWAKIGRSPHKYYINGLPRYKKSEVLDVINSDDVMSDRTNRYKRRRK